MAESWLPASVRVFGPRVTREMVEGPPVGLVVVGSDVPLRFCGLCGAALLALGSDGAAMAGMPDIVERHRNWHDGLVREVDRLEGYE
jgi:hypothetical protein